MPPHRLAYFDNLKAVLIFTVVFGHALNHFSHSFQGNYLLTLLYTFHLYLFVFVAGIFSRSFTDTKKLTRSLISLTAAYLSLSALNYLLVFFSFPIDPAALSLTHPYAFLWFVVSLICWRATVPFIKPFTHRSPLITITVVLIGSMLLGSQIDFTWPLALSNTVHFYPFFVLGLALGTQPTSSHLHRLPLFPVLILAGFLTWYVSSIIGDHTTALAWLLGHTSLRLLPAASLAPFLKNIGLIYLLASLNSLVVLKLVLHPPPVANLGRPSHPGHLPDSLLLHPFGQPRLFLPHPLFLVPQHYLYQRLVTRSYHQPRRYRSPLSGPPIPALTCPVHTL